MLFLEVKGLKVYHYSYTVLTHPMQHLVPTLYVFTGKCDAIKKIAKVNPIAKFMHDSN